MRIRELLYISDVRAVLEKKHVQFCRFQRDFEEKQEKKRQRREEQAVPETSLAKKC